MVRPGFRREDGVPDIFDEVAEDLRTERMHALLRRYGGAVVAVVLLILAAVAGWQIWLHHQGQRDAAAAAEFLATVQKAEMVKPGDASQAKAVANDFTALASRAPHGYRVLAELRAAALKAEAGDQAGALALWNRVAADQSTDLILRNLASLLWVENQIDTGDPATLESRLKPLEDPTSAWHALANEAQALLDIRTGKTAAARTVLETLAKDPTASQNVRARAAGLLTRIGGA